MELKVEYVGIDTIKPYKRNAKTHPKEQIEQIKKSIQEFGNCDPIGVWHGEIVEGHGRYLALKELGEKTIPIIRLDELTDDQRKAYGLVHNQLTMNSPWDFEMLDLELPEIDMDLSVFCFDDCRLSSEQYGDSFSLPDGDKPNAEQITFIFAKKQREIVLAACRCVEDEIKETCGNTNKMGNCLYEVVRQWAELKKLNLK